MRARVLNRSENFNPIELRGIVYIFGQDDGTVTFWFENDAHWTVKAQDIVLVTAMEDR